MNLYVECSKVLHSVHNKKGSIKKLVYSSDYDNKKQLYGLVCDTLKHGGVLQQILENTQLLQKEWLLKNDKFLAHALLHDFILTKGVVRAGRLKQTIKRNKAEIFAECERILLEAGVDSFYDLLPESVKISDSLPRYVRVNLLKTSVNAVIKQFEKDGWEKVDNTGLNSDSFIEAVRKLGESQFILDIHLYDVIVFPPSTDFHDNGMLAAGEIILQDKASCFPAHVLSAPEGAAVIDCCAAPGNKTSHIASLNGNSGNIFAFDKDGRRMATLQYLTSRAGVNCITGRCQDFLRVNPLDEKYADVEYVLVDPSCSGSGIVSRMNEITDDQASVSQERLKSLSNFQVTILKHVFSFPNVKRVVYSTCSIHPEENEAVVEEVMNHVSGNFKICKVFPDWPYRGQEGYDHTGCFLRMKPKNALTNGFFVACFERKSDKNSEKGHTDNVTKSMCCTEVTKHHSKKEKKKREAEKQDSDSTEMIKVKKKHKKVKKEKFLGDLEESQDSQPTVSAKKKQKKLKDSPYTEVETETQASGEHKKQKKNKYMKRSHDKEGNVEQGDILETVVESSCRSKKRRHKELDSHSAAENDYQEIKKRKKKNKKEKADR